MFVGKEYSFNCMALFEISINNSNDFISFVSPIIGIVISAFIAWHTYRKQAVENEVKANIATFSYLLSLIFKNFEELTNIKEQISTPALEEINNFLDTLDEIEKRIDWALGVGEAPICIEVPDKMSYAMEEVARLSKKLILSVATIQHFTYIDTTSFKKEAVLLSHFGDLNFGTVCNRLDTQYNIITSIQETIKQYNEENLNKPRAKFHNIKIISNDKNYKENLNKAREQMLYRKSLFVAYDTTVTRSLVMSYNAACHLEAFFYHYLKKYCVVANRLGTPFKTLQLKDETFFNNDIQFQLYLNSILPNEYQIFSIPLYTNLKRNFGDKFSDFIFYLKWE